MKQRKQSMREIRDAAMTDRDFTPATPPTNAPGNYTKTKPQYFRGARVPHRRTNSN